MNLAMVSRIQNRTTVLNKEFSIVPEETTKEFFSYFEHTIVNLLDYVYEDDKQKFIDLFNGTEPKRSAILRFKKNTDEYKFNLTTIEKEDFEGNKEIKILEIDEVMEKNEMLYVESRFLRKILSITGEFMFNYSINKNNIQIIQYANENKIIIADMDLNAWVDRLLEQGIVSEEHREELDILVYDLKRTPKNINHKLVGGIRTNSNIMENLRIIGVYHEDIGLGEKFVVGRIITDLELQEAISSKTLIGELQIDPLTGLYNKKTITNYVNQRLQSGNKNEKFSLVIMDLDNFKPVNDQFGHMAGDSVLSRVAKKVKDLIGEDGIIGRIGGDEFLLVLNGVDNVQILRGFLRAILVQVKKEFEGNFEGISLTCSLGAAVYPTNGETYEDLFQKADFCLYIAKDKGRDRYVFFRDDLHGIKYAEFMGAKRSGQKTDRREVQELKYMDKFFFSLKTNKKSAIMEMFRHMLGTYLIDAINVYFGTDMKRVLSLGMETVDLSEAKYALTEDFKKELVEDRYIAYNFQSNFPKEGALAEALRNRETQSTIQYILGKKDNIKGLVTFDKIRAPQQWAAYEISCASIVASVLDVIGVEKFVGGGGLD